jgi:integrase
MAWIELARSGVYQVCFRLGDKRFSRSLRTGREKEAESAKGVLEENLRLVERGRLEIPPGADVAAFLLSNGKVSGAIKINTVTVPELFTQYFAALPHGSLEASTIYTMGIHRKSLEKHFGKRLVESIDHGVLQAYVKSRAVEPVTIRKELGTFKTVWNFGLASGLLSVPYPPAKLMFPKGEQKPPFTSFGELLKRTKGQPSELWECCYLTKEDLRELLLHVKKVAAPAFVYPLFMTAAYTGARRSELARARVGDVELGNGVLTLHERKRSREQKTTRRVPLVPELRRVLRSWVRGREGALFVHGGEPLTRKAMAYRFDGTLSGSKWQYLRGYHVFRHSMASILASDGVDQRVIDEILGHQTIEMQRRYRHLFPNKVRESVVAVFA